MNRTIEYFNEHAEKQFREAFMAAYNFVAPKHGMEGTGT
jgi:hypothetical protein